MSANFCPRCGRPWLAGFRFCGGCGLEVEPPVTPAAPGPAATPPATPVTPAVADHSAWGAAPAAEAPVPTPDPQPAWSAPQITPPPAAAPSGPTGWSSVPSTPPPNTPSPGWEAPAGGTTPWPGSAAPIVPAIARKRGPGRVVAIVGIVAVIAIAAVVGGMGLLGGGGNRGAAGTGAPASSGAVTAADPTPTAAPSPTQTPRATPRPTPVPIRDSGEIGIREPYALTAITLSTAGQIESGARDTGFLDAFAGNDIERDGVLVGHVIRLTFKSATPQVFVDEFLSGVVESLDTPPVPDTVGGLPIQVVRGVDPGWAVFTVDKTLWMIATYDGSDIDAAAEAIIAAASE